MGARAAARRRATSTNRAARADRAAGPTGARLRLGSAATSTRVAAARCLRGGAPVLTSRAGSLPDARDLTRARRAGRPGAGSAREACRRRCGQKSGAGCSAALGLVLPTSPAAANRCPGRSCGGRAAAGRGRTGDCDTKAGTTAARISRSGDNGAAAGAAVAVQLPHRRQRIPEKACYPDPLSSMRNGLSASRFV